MRGLRNKGANGQKVVRPNRVNVRRETGNLELSYLQRLRRVRQVEGVQGICFSEGDDVGFVTDKAG